MKSWDERPGSRPKCSVKGDAPAPADALHAQRPASDEWVGYSTYELSAPEHSAQCPARRSPLFFGGQQSSTGLLPSPGSRKLKVRPFRKTVLRHRSLSPVGSRPAAMGDTACLVATGGGKSTPGASPRSRQQGSPLFGAYVDVKSRLRRSKSALGNGAASARPSKKLLTVDVGGTFSGRKHEHPGPAPTGLKLGHSIVSLDRKNHITSASGCSDAAIQPAAGRQGVYGGPTTPAGKRSLMVELSFDKQATNLKQTSLLKSISMNVEKAMGRLLKSRQFANSALAQTTVEEVRAQLSDSAKLSTDERTSTGLLQGNERPSSGSPKRSELYSSEVTLLVERTETADLSQQITQLNVSMQGQHREQERLPSSTIIPKVHDRPRTFAAKLRDELRGSKLSKSEEGFSEKDPLETADKKKVPAKEKSTNKKTKKKSLEEPSDERRLSLKTPPETSSLKITLDKRIFSLKEVPRERRQSLKETHKEKDTKKDTDKDKKESAKVPKRRESIKESDESLLKASKESKDSSEKASKKKVPSAKETQKRRPSVKASVEKEESSPMEKQKAKPQSLKEESKKSSSQQKEEQPLVHRKRKASIAGTRAESDRSSVMLSKVGKGVPDEGPTKLKQSKKESQKERKKSLKPVADKEITSLMDKAKATKHSVTEKLPKATPKDRRKFVKEPPDFESASHIKSTKSRKQSLKAEPEKVSAEPSRKSSFKDAKRKPSAGSTISNAAESHVNLPKKVKESPEKRAKKIKPSLKEIADEAEKKGESVEEDQRKPGAPGGRRESLKSPKKKLSIPDEWPGTEESNEVVKLSVESAYSIGDALAETRESPGDMAKRDFTQDSSKKAEVPKAVVSKKRDSEDDATKEKLKRGKISEQDEVQKTKKGKGAKHDVEDKTTSKQVSRGAKGASKKDSKKRRGSAKAPTSSAPKQQKITLEKITLESREGGVHKDGRTVPKKVAEKGDEKIKGRKKSLKEVPTTIDSTKQKSKQRKESLMPELADSFLKDEDKKWQDFLEDHLAAAIDNVAAAYRKADRNRRGSARSAPEMKMDAAKDKKNQSGIERRGSTKRLPDQEEEPLPKERRRTSKEKERPKPGGRRESMKSVRNEEANLLKEASVPAQKNATKKERETKRAERRPSTKSAREEAERSKETSVSKKEKNKKPPKDSDRRGSMKSFHEKEVKQVPKKKEQPQGDIKDSAKPRVKDMRESVKSESKPSEPAKRRASMKREPKEKRGSRKLTEDPTKEKKRGKHRKKTSRNGSESPAKFSTDRQSLGKRASEEETTERSQSHPSSSKKPQKISEPFPEPVPIGAKKRAMSIKEGRIDFPEFAFEQPEDLDDFIDAFEMTLEPIVLQKVEERLLPQASDRDVPEVPLVRPRVEEVQRALGTSKMTRTTENAVPPKEKHKKESSEEKKSKKESKERKKSKERKPSKRASKDKSSKRQKPKLSKAKSGEKRPPEKSPSETSRKAKSGKRKKRDVSKVTTVKPTKPAITKFQWSTTRVPAISGIQRVLSWSTCHLGISQRNAGQRAEQDVPWSTKAKFTTTPFTPGLTRQADPRMMPLTEGTRMFHWSTASVPILQRAQQEFPSFAKDKLTATLTSPGPTMHAESRMMQPTEGTNLFHWSTASVPSVQSTGQDVTMPTRGKLTATPISPGPSTESRMAQPTEGLHMWSIGNVPRVQSAEQDVPWSTKAKLTAAPISPVTAGQTESRMMQLAGPHMFRWCTANVPSVSRLPTSFSWTTGHLGISYRPSASDAHISETLGKPLKKKSSLAKPVTKKKKRKKQKRSASKSKTTSIPSSEPTQEKPKLVRDDPGKNLTASTVGVPTVLEASMSGVSKAQGIAKSQEAQPDVPDVSPEGLKVAAAIRVAEKSLDEKRKKLEAKKSRKVSKKEKHRTKGKHRSQSTKSSSPKNKDKDLEAVPLKEKSKDRVKEDGGEGAVEIHTEQSMIFCCILLSSIVFVLLILVVVYLLLPKPLTVTSSASTGYYSESTAENDTDSYITAEETSQDMDFTATVKTMSHPPMEYYCDTAFCNLEGSYIKSLLSSQIKPCENFYDYVCDLWSQQNLADSSGTGSLVSRDTVLQDSLAQQLLPFIRDSTEEDLRVAADMHYYCTQPKLNDAAAESTRIVRDMFHEWAIKAWPCSDAGSDTLETVWRFAAELLRDLDLAPFLGVKIVMNPNNLEKTVVELYHPPPVFHEIDHYVNEGMRLFKGAVKETIEEFRGTCSESFIEQVMFVYGNFSAASKQAEDGSQSFASVRITELNEGIQNFLQKLFSDVVSFDRTQNVVLRSPTYVEVNLPTLMKRFRPRDLLDYMGFLVLVQLAPFLSNQLRNLRSLFTRSIMRRTIADVTNSSLLCLRAVEKLLPHCFSKASVQLRQNAGLDLSMRERIFHLKSLFKRQLPKFVWLDDLSALFVRYRLKTSNLVLFGHDNQTCAPRVELGTGGPLKFYLNVSRLQQARRLEAILHGSSHLRSTFYGSELATESRYDPTLKIIHVPMALMNTSVPSNTTMFAFHLSRFAVRLYKGLMPILYENSYEHKASISQDSQRNQRALCNCLVDDLRHVPTSSGKESRGHVAWKPKYSHPGTPCELLDQTSAVKLSLMAFQEFLHTRRIWSMDYRLNSLPDHSAEQLFFIYYALDNCQSTNNINEATQNVAMPADYRVNLPLRHLEEFSTAFNCEKGSALRPEQDPICPVFRRQQSQGRGGAKHSRLAQQHGPRSILGLSGDRRRLHTNA